MINISVNKRGPVGPPVDFPGDTPQERYEWCIRHMSRDERRHMEDQRQIRRGWLRENNPAALAAA